ncbi:MAG: hypothetical protein EHM32_11105 [Spirochaetales bacterium]|nr:MAG: hypothetical protein EHM32_11105 [Spirochaetales bacterium]
MLEKIIDINSIIRRLTARTRHAKAVISLACVLVIGVSGFGLGQVGGRALMKDFLTGGGRLVPLLYRPSFQHLTTAAMLGSADELQRLAGYYALLEGDSIDIDFLKERYGMERSIVTRRTIVWLMGFSRDVRSAVDACAGLYESAPPGIRKEILRSIKRLDRASYRDFMENLGKGARRQRQP